ncbi:Exo70 exocyst complex subunit [Anaeromyces robustus]|uniref:Exocyst complex protein EXO70 n=1 Tax=Anaeromyces robustus TaxID=1754192 RepID=A0A1Y1X3D4_9FUNG|nr:Exo70 exocyst complex subunit [Anaeromyces robustus]|eukprot:ORX80175.1 Exo70 exocyst complex subunit [Anaeromyces robustus]
MISNQSLNQKEFEQMIEEEVTEVEFMEQNLKKTKELTEKMVNMLSSFDERLEELETSVIPIHRSTQKITLLYDNIDSTLNSVNSYISYFDLATEIEGLISYGPSESNLNEYLNTIKKLKDAYKYVLETPFESFEKTSVKMGKVLKDGIEKLDSLFKNWLNNVSSSVDSEDIEKESQKNKINKIQENLRMLSEYLYTCKDKTYESSKFFDIYVDVRSGYLLKNVQNIYKETRDQILTQYQPGSTKFIEYTRDILKVIKKEKDFSRKCLVKNCVVEGYSKALTPMIDQYIDVSEGIIQQVNKNLVKRNFSDIFVIFDIFGVFHEQSSLLKENINGTPELEEKFKQVTDNIVDCAIIFFKNIYDNIKNDTSKTLSIDGTVYELTSNTVNCFKRFIDYKKPIEIMLTDIQNGKLKTNDDSLSSQPILNEGPQAYYNDIIDILISMLETKSHGYKKDSLARIFLINNYNYILKNIQNSKLSEMISGDIGPKFNGIIKTQINAYMDSWNTCVLSLMDVTYVQDGSIKTTLSKSQKQTIKESFKSFNSKFDEIYKVHKAYSIPDTELRRQILNEIKQVIIPMYGRFYKKYQNIEFTKNPSKYIQWTKENIEDALDKLFSTSTD